ncbi:MAG: hypothetical protein AAGK78_07600 [Planctomycetota bacterium]
MAFKPILDKPRKKALWKSWVSKALFLVFGLASLCVGGFFAMLMLGSGLSLMGWIGSFAMAATFG